MYSVTGTRQHAVFWQLGRNNWGHFHSSLGWSSLTWIVIWVWGTKCRTHTPTYSLCVSRLQTLFLVPASLGFFVGIDFVLAFPSAKGERKAQPIWALRSRVRSQDISIMYFSLAVQYGRHTSLLYSAEEIIWDIINNTCPLFVLTPYSTKASLLQLCSIDNW